MNKNDELILEILNRFEKDNEEMENMFKSVGYTDPQMNIHINVRLECYYDLTQSLFEENGLLKEQIQILKQKIEILQSGTEQSTKEVKQDPKMDVEKQLYDTFKLRS